MVIGGWLRLAGTAVLALVVLGGCSSGGGASSSSDDATPASTASSLPGKLERIPMPLSSDTTATTSSSPVAVVSYACGTPPCKVFMPVDFEDAGTPTSDVHVEDGQRVRVACQRTGPVMTNDVTGEQSTIWYQLSGGPYLSAAFAHVDSTVPAC